VKLASWLNSVNGSRVDVDHVYGAQCFDLVNDYVKSVLGLPYLAGAYAVDIQHDRPKGFMWVANGPDNAPTPGSVVVWQANDRAGTGAAGHCAVALLADDRSLITIDQNWPTGHATAIVFHNYDGVVGWLAPMVPVR